MDMEHLTLSIIMMPQFCLMSVLATILLITLSPLKSRIFRQEALVK